MNISFGQLVPAKFPSVYHGRTSVGLFIWDAQTVNRFSLKTSFDSFKPGEKNRLNVINSSYACNVKFVSSF